MACSLKRSMPDYEGMQRVPRMRKKNKRYESDDDENAENIAPNGMEKPLVPLGQKLRLDNLKMFPIMAREPGVEPVITEPMDVGTQWMQDHSQQVPTQDIGCTKAEEAVWERPDGIGNPGQIKKVVLENFMCHQHFAMEFVPNINFISGQNGSGKSALLQACQQVLGVSARDTGRASSQSAFIRTGASEAKITITLWNEGPDAYRPREYGKEIIIERIIGKSSSWATKSASGTKIGKKRMDLDDILAYFSIDGSNPITVMTQDVTRSFLAGSTDKLDKNKYAIYQQATMLDRVKVVNQICEMKVEEMQQSVMETKKKFQELKAERDEAKKALDNMVMIEGAREEAVRLQKVLAWSAFSGIERTAQALKARVEAGPALAAQLDAELQEAQTAADCLEGVSAEQQAAMESFTVEAEKLAEELTQLQIRQKDASAEVKKAARNVSRWEQHIKELEEAKEVLLSAIKDTEEGTFAETRAAMSAHEEQLKELTSEAALLEAKKEAVMLKQRAASEARVQAIKALEDARAELQFHAKECTTLERCMRTAAEEQNNRRWWFKGDRLWRAIQVQSRRFHRLPVGPLGFYLGVKEDRWATTVEAALIGHLNKFLVHDHHDLQILKEVARQSGVQMPRVDVLRLDVPQHTLPPHALPPPSVLTVLQVLTCTDSSAEPAIFNSLIDTAGVEKVVLCNSLADAREAVRHPNCRSAFFAEGDSCVRRGCTETVYPAPSGLQKLLSGNAEDRLGQLRWSLQGAQAAKRRAEAAFHEGTERYDAADRLFKDAQQEYKDARACLETVHTRRQEAATQAPFMPGNDENEMEVDGVQHDLGEKLQAISDANWSLSSARAELEQLQAKELLAKEATEAARSKISNLQGSNDSALQSITDREAAIEEAHVRLVEVERKRDAFRKQVELLQDKLEQVSAEVAEYRSKAEEVCSHKEGMAAAEALNQEYLSRDGWTPDMVEQLVTNTGALTKLLEKTAKKIRAAEKEAGGLREEVEAGYMDLKVKVSDARSSTQAIIDHYVRLHAALADRKLTYERLSRNAEELVSTLFNKYMARKGHTGTIKLDKEAQTLEIKVKISSSKDADKVKDLKQLSGGERSFTTVCFALALGEYTQSPFRAMDEFDVFMDAVNRRISLVSLFENALLHPDIQFLLLTPQDISAVEEAKRHLADELGKPIPDGFLKVVCMPAARPTGRIHP